jgi:hypothetical protein
MIWTNPIFAIFQIIPEVKDIILRVPHRITVMQNVFAVIPYWNIFIYLALREEKAVMEIYT